MVRYNTNVVINIITVYYCLLSVMSDVTNDWYDIISRRYTIGRYDES